MTRSAGSPFLAISLTALFALAVPRPAEAISVMIYSCDPSYDDDTLAKLTDLGWFDSVGLQLVNSSTPTLAEMLQYEAVLIYSNGGFGSATAMGDVIADYLDAGGGVVMATFSFWNGNGLGIEGRVKTDGYLPFTTDEQDSPGGLTLVADLPGHPLLDGVTSFNGGSSSYHNESITTVPGATQVARWSNGQPLVAEWTPSAGTFVGLNFFPPSSDIRNDFWVSSTDGDILMGNALLFAADSCDDVDGDGYEDATCGGDDCDDGDASINPQATELLDGIDQDCDGMVDEGALGFGAVVITEIMKNPDEVFDDHGEWIELYNGAGLDVNLYGLEVADLGTDAFTVDADLWVAPGDHVVLGASADAGLNGGVTVDHEYVDFTLANNGDDEIVLTFGGVELDRVVFGDAPWPDATGVAAQLGWPGYDATGNDDPGAWCDAVDVFGDGDLGTPGAENASCCWDLDGDGYGDAACGGDDCDDTDADVFPGATEYCNAIDDDCDGSVDDGAIDAIVWYIDVDGDGFGNAQVSMTACAQPAGFVLAATDCDDNAPLVNPDAEESCNFVDDDCNGLVDDDAADAGTWYHDDDGDGFGDDDGPIVACNAPAGTVGAGGDCDDNAPAINPGADELCNGLDDDCDGAVDEADAIDAQTWYLDDDGDGFGDAGDSTTACTPPPDHVSNDADCDDDLATVYPGASEVCDGVDNNCDGLVDGPGSVDAQTWYLDADGDGFGNLGATTTECAPPPGYVANAADCDDTNAGVFPGADEICNGIDDDCDAATNEIADSDGDGATICDGDCDDDEADAFPGNDEICDGIDNDCDPATDELADGDGDGWTICGGDCDDGEADVHPTHAEDCDGVDNDCDGNLLPDEVDDDGDGWLPCGGDCDDTDPLTYEGAPEQCDELDNDCDGDVDEDTGVDLDGDGTNACQGDCNDQDPAVGPHATEICDGADTDCDGITPADEVDADVDGWRVCDGDCDDGDDTLNLDDADADGWTTCDGDCDDDAGGVFPGATETAYDGIDQDCDGADLTDVDGDGYDGGTAGDDCDDEDADVRPDADEICDDGVDNDCDGDTDADDEDCATGDDDDTTGDDDDTTGDDDLPGDDDTGGDDDDDTDPDDCACSSARQRPAPTALIAITLLLGTLMRRRAR